MPFPLTPDALDTCMKDVFDYQYPDFAAANNLVGGGGYENWALVNFLRYLKYRYGDFDYRREFPAQRTGGTQVRVDLAFNANSVTPATPLILTEWKCNPDLNALATGCTQDVQKFVDVLGFYGSRKFYPLPLVFGIGPDGPPVANGFTKFGFGSGLALYASSPATWSALGLLGYTWYEHQPLPEPVAQDGAPPAPVLIANHPSRPRPPLPRRAEAEADLAEPV
ncbi:hypothetical protein ABTZ99_02200 [Actinosynnema sp. NPDC002837]